MSGFLDRLAARAVGEAPLVHPRVRARFEPYASELPGGPVEPAAEIAEGEEVAAMRRVEVREPEGVERTFEPEPRRLSTQRPERSTIEPAVAAREATRKESGPRRDPHPLAPSPTRAPTLPGEGETDFSPISARARVVAPPLPGEGSTDGRGGREVRVHEAVPPERRRLAVSPEPIEPPPPLRLRSALAEELPTVELDRRAPLPPSLEESEPAETVVHVSIGRIDVRAAQPPAPERRPARPIAGPRLNLEDYLKRREERRQ